jgi:hypothetical protein
MNDKTKLPFSYQQGEFVDMKQEVERFNKKTKVVNFFGGPSSGKCFQKGTKVLMFNGSIKNVEDIKLYDELMGPDSKRRIVLNLSHGKDFLYKISPVKGDSYKVTKNHILPLKFKHHAKEKDFFLSVKDFLEESKFKKGRLKQYRIGIDFISQEIFLDPYFIGLWLGDGNNADQRITNSDNEIIEFLQDYAKELGLKLQQTKTNTSFVNALSVGRNGGKPNIVLDKLRELNLLNNKHIPQIYKINNKEIRLQLLAGILDTDGFLGKKTFDIIQKSKEFATDIVFLARSLGLAAYMNECEKSCPSNKQKSGIFTGTYYRISISGETSIIPTRVSHKQAEKRLLNKDVLRTGIKVTPCQTKEEYYGFEVDGDHLFLLADFTVTHNSTTASLLFGKLKQAGVNCELVQEYAKDKTWEGSFGVLQNQLLILGKQSHRQFRCRDQVDLIITDSPLLLSLHYAKHLSPEFKEVVRQTFNEYDNFNYLVERGDDFAYNPIGRSQTEAEAHKIHLSLKSMLLQEVNNCKTIRRGEIDLPIIVEDILSVIK